MGIGSPDRLGNAENVREFLKELVDKLEMRLLGEPHLYEVEIEIDKLGKVPFEDEGGVTGIAVLSTSHCSIHTWPARPFFVLDVYSCRDFRREAVEAAVQNSFDGRELKFIEVDVSYP